MDKEDKTDNKH